MNRREFCWTAATFAAATKVEASQQPAVPPGMLDSPVPAPMPSFANVDGAPLSGPKEGALLLHEGWQMREEAICGAHGELFSQADFSGSESWYSTTVPTTTLGTLIRHGIYPDPYIGLNNLLIPDASPEHNERFQLTNYSHLPDKANPWSKPYWFRSTFSLPSNFLGTAIWLHLDGINYRADIWINGSQVAHHSQTVGMFQRFRFNVSQLVRRHATNGIAICIYPLDYPGDPLDEQLGGVDGGFGPNGGDGEITRNVTQYCTIGWDWVPAARDRNVGIWQHIWLESTGDVAVRDAAGFVKLSAARDSAALTVKFSLENTKQTSIPVEVTIRVKPDGFSGQSIELRSTLQTQPASVEEFAFTAAEHTELVLSNPKLWWPRGYGEQPLYTLTVEAWIEGARSSSTSSKIGMRTVGTAILPSGGRAFTVNDRVIRMTGGAWVPDFLLSWSAQRYRDEVRLMAEGNHTIVRVNGCGIMPPDVFFDECDKRGLLVWQDFSRTSISPDARKDHIHSGNPMDCNPSVLLDNMKDCILRMRSHPSLLLYCGCNEQTPQSDFGVPMQNSVLPAMDDTRPWLPSSGSNPSWEKEQIHTYSFGPYELIRLPEYFRRFAEAKDFTCKNEIGLASPPPINSFTKALPTFTSSVYGSAAASKELSYHDGTGKQFREMLGIMHNDLGTPASVAEFLLMADLYNSSAYRAIYEAANKARPRNAGVHLWKINAALPSMMWQVFDWTLRCNAGYYGMKSACKPLHVQQSVDDFTVQVVSTLNDEQPGMHIPMQLFTIDGALHASKQWRATIPPDSTAHVESIADLVQDGRLYFLGLTLRTEAGEEVDRSVTWLQKECKWQDLFRLKPTVLSISSLGQSQQNGETTYRLAVTNPSKIPAVHVLLSLLNQDRGDELLPSFWSDNGICLLPGETKQLAVTCRDDLLSGAQPHVMVEGWNVMPVGFRLADGKSIHHDIGSVTIEKDSEQGVIKIKVVPQGTGFKPSRITTWPLLIAVNDKPFRTVRVSTGGRLAGTEPYAAVLKLNELGPADRVSVL